MLEDSLDIDSLKELGIVYTEEENIEEINRDISEFRQSITQGNHITTNEDSTQNTIIKNASLNSIIIGVYDDYFQKLYIDSTTKNLEYPNEIITVKSEKDIQNIKYLIRKSIFNEKTIVKISLKCKLTNPILNFLKSIYYKNKLVILLVPNHRTSNFLNKNLDIYFENNNLEIPITHLKNTSDYSVKKELIEKTIDNMGLKTKNKEVRSLLIKIIISKIKEFETIKTSLDVAVINDILITEEYLEDIAGTIDFYKLEDLFENILRGLSYKKTIKYLNYFLEIKKYSPDWILTQFKEYILNVSNFYTLKYKGIIKHPLDKTTLKSRITASKLSGLNYFYDINKYEQQQFLDIVNDIPFNYISEFSKIIFNVKYINVDKMQLYSAILELYSLKNKYGSEKGFVNSRKLREMKINAKYKKKK